MKAYKKIRNWVDERLICWKYFMAKDNSGMGTVEVILIIVDILTI